MNVLSIPFALGPLAIYLVAIGLINVLPKPRLCSGTLDFAALCLGISGLVIVGPIQILLPHTAMLRFGDNAWSPMLFLYLFSATWLLIIRRPRLVIYNIRTGDGFCDLIEKTLRRNHWTSQGAGNILQIEELGIQFEILSISAMRNVTLRATRAEQSPTGWHLLRKELSTELQTVRGGFSLVGGLMVMVGLLMFTVACTSLEPL